MNMNNIILLVLAVSLLNGCGNSEPTDGNSNQPITMGQSEASGPVTANYDGQASFSNIPDGVYSVDKMHTYVTFSYLHMGYSYPLLRVTGIDGQMNLNLKNMAESTVAIAIEANTIDSSMPKFNTELQSLQYFNVKNYPHIAYTTHSYVPLTETTGTLTGYLTIKGKTRPMILEVTLNNAIINPFSKKPVIGFSAKGTLNRSEFGLARNIPLIADEVLIDISSEFVQGSTPSSLAAVKIANEITEAAPADSLVIATTN